MKDPRVVLSKEEEGIGVVTLQDVAARNAFHQPFVDELVEQLDRVAADQEIRVCVLRGLPDVFCAGAHEDVLLDLAQGKLAASDLVLSKAVLDLPIPIIAAMEGHAVGGGLTLGLCCDVVLMSRSSRYGCSFMNMGFTPGMGTTRLLKLAVGEYVANEMMFGGQMFKGTHFDHHPGINYVLPRGQVTSKAMQLARRIAEKPRFALTLLKRHLSLPRRQAFEESLTTESMMHELCFAQPETFERIEENYVGTGRKG